ncbi:hypothetical protein JCM10212_004596 [Sporobolomyces blumeae]
MDRPSPAAQPDWTPPTTTDVQPVHASWLSTPCIADRLPSTTSPSIEMTQPLAPYGVAYPPSTSGHEQPPFLYHSHSDPIHRPHSASTSSQSHRSNSDSTTSTRATSSGTPSPYPSASLVGPGSQQMPPYQPHPPQGSSAASLLQQHQANQHAFRSNSAQHAFVFQNQSGPFPPHGRSATESDSREGSAPSSRNSDPGTQGGEQDPSSAFYDPFRIKHRRRTSPPQLKILEHHFDINPKPDVNTRKVLSEQLGMTPREVQVWFQNRRAKVKKLREKAEREANSATGSPSGTTPPISQSDVSPATTTSRSPNLLTSAADGLPIPPAMFSMPGAGPYQSRTIYGQDAISQRRGSSPVLAHAPGYSMSSFPPPLPPQPIGPADLPPAPGPWAPAYQSTVYTTTVASSTATYARNDFLPPGHGTFGQAPLQPVPLAPAPAPSFPYLSQDPMHAPSVPPGGRRYSLPAPSSEPPAWAQPFVTSPPPATAYAKMTTLSDSATGEEYPAYAPPTSTAFASSSLEPRALLDPSSSIHPDFAPAYPDPSAYPSSYYDQGRRGSFAPSESLSYESPSEVTFLSQAQPPLDPLTSFAPFPLSDRAALVSHDPSLPPRPDPSDSSMLSLLPPKLEDDSSISSSLVAPSSGPKRRPSLVSNSTRARPYDV